MVVFNQLFHFTSPEIIRAFRSAITRHSCDGLEFVVAPASKEHGRLLVITPRKTGNAVERNRIRRRLKSIYYEQQYFKYPYDIIIRIHQRAMLLSFDQLKTVMYNLFAKLG